MRIALFAETYLPYINGVVTHVKILKEGLERLGHTVLVVTADANVNTHFVLDNVLHCPATRVRKFYNYGVAVPYSQKRMRLVEQFKPDIIHIHQEFGVSLSGMMIAKQLRVPLVYTLHTMYDDYIYYVAPEMMADAAKQVSYKYFKFIAQNADALTGPSKKCEEYFRKIGITKPVNIIPNAAELEAFMQENIPEEKKAAARAYFGLPEGKTSVCFVGRLGKEKSVDLLLDYWAEAITEKDNLHLIIIGEGPVRQELIAQAKALGIENMVTFTGAIDHADIPPYLAVCDIYITASLSDTNSISMLEGMAAGLPVLQRLDPLNADQVREGVNGYLFNSPREMAEKLRLVQAMPKEELAALRKSVRESVMKSGAVTLAENTMAAYKQAIENKKNTRHFFSIFNEETE